ncbi:MAG TPA: glycoside hydrolase family 2 TIM barrel-domain containing protein [Bacilli bacterium]|nr:glycoside hydrolase family 2 TIM barrel-domain containing protein [Bacilli bacterium]
MLNRFPRPSFLRKKWVSLNGTWHFAFDDDNIGVREQWYSNKDKYPLLINVPYTFETQLSGINRQEHHDHVWYYRELNLRRDKSNPVVILHFQAVDYSSKYYLNGELVAENIGGQTPISIDISDKLNYKNDVISVYVEDKMENKSQPRGKQYWKEKPEIIWYNRTTGIWGSVWAEYLPTDHITQAKITPLYDEGKVSIELFVNNPGRPYMIKVAGKTIKGIASDQKTKISIEVFKDINVKKRKSWTPEHPFLFPIIFCYGIDKVKSYFGMRKVEAKAGRILLNNEPYFLKMVLDQGYYPKSLLTAPSYKQLKKDILMTKAMGFNGARLHQKVADEWFLYYADRLGYIVWGEDASGYEFNDELVKSQINDWKRIVARDYNHPSIIAWIPLNESWGVPDISYDKSQQQFSVDIVNTIKEMDPTRLVVSNDGWEQTIGDLCCIHNYNHGQRSDEEKQRKFSNDISSVEKLIASTPAKKKIYADGYAYKGQPIILSEFGGIAYNSNNGWGYTSVKNSNELLEEYARIIDAVKNSSGLAGFCYTQLTDVQQEINGLLTFDRKYKIKPNKVRKVNSSIAKGGPR